MAYSIDDLLRMYTEAASKAEAATQQRYEQATAIYDEIIRRYSPGGTFQRQALEQLGAQKTMDVGSAAQQLISSGLYGTQAGAGLGMGWERAVGAPARLKLEDIMMERLSGAMQAKAGFLERVEDVGPSPELIAQLAQQAGQASQAPGYPMVGRIGGLGAGGGPGFDEWGTLTTPTGYTQPSLAGGGGYGGEIAPAGSTWAGNVGAEYTPGTYTYPSEAELESGIAEYMGWGQESGMMPMGETGAGFTPGTYFPPYAEKTPTEAVRPGIIKRPHPITGKLIPADDPVFQQYKMSYLPTGGTTWTKSSVKYPQSAHFIPKI